LRPRQSGQRSRMQAPHLRRSRLRRGHHG
jgi:hypothetical protein